jgi:PAS domain S-box-containing protein
MPHKLRSHVIDLGVALLGTAAAVLIRLALNPWLGQFRPFVTLYWAIGFVAFARGFRPALLTAFLGYLACDYLFAHPRASMFYGNRGYVGHFFFTLACAIFIGCGHGVRAIRLRLQAERERLRDSHEFHEAIASLTADFAFAGRFGPNGEMVVKTITEGFTNLLGYARADILGSPEGWTSLVHPEDLHVAAESLRLVAAGETNEGELRSVAKDGRIVWLRYRHRPVRDEQGQIVGLTGAIQDITERKLAELALRDVNRRKDEFLATLAHELRNPLAPISNALELMRRGKDDPELTEQARNIMERQVQQLVRLTDDLLDTSRITQGKLQLRKERMDLVAAVQIAVEANRPLIDGAGHELTVTPPPTPIWVDADLTRIAQVFSNLLNNAVKYTEPAGRIWLTVEKRGNGAVVSVKDTGIGIAADHLPHVFEMFSQSQPALERSKGGLGIGLSLVRRLIDAHSGHVEVRSDGPGLGSEFLIYLPVIEYEPEATKPEEIGPTAVGPTHAHVPCRVLIVDDNLDATAGLSMMMEYYGHETRVANDGQQAIEQTESFRPHVVLLDIGLPIKNGYEVAQHIRSQPWGAEIILIALTGWGQDDDKQRARDAGFNHHLSKPVKSTDLQRIIQSLLQQPALT